MCHHKLQLAVASGCALAAPMAAHSQALPAEAEFGTEADAGSVSEIVVFGRGEAKIGSAHAASEGSISDADLLVRPLLRVAELLEAVPGLVAAQHSGSGKANQYFLRGFNLDHGTDFTAYIDGVQMNLRSHGHGQGYLDLNGLIPETIAREDFRKGSYRADGGDFALAGAAYFRTIDRIDRPWVSLEAGSYGWRRLATGGTILGRKDDALTLVAEAKAYDGPWQEPEHLSHIAGFAKYIRPIGDVSLAVSLQAYHATWRPTEQIPENAVGTAACPTIFCSPDPSARGRTTRLIGNVGLEAASWSANLYAQVYDWRMFSNPTYAEPDGQSAQIEQFDRRWIVGGTGRHSWTLDESLKVTVGGEARYDHVGNVGVYRTDRRNFVASLGRFRVSEGSAALFGEAEWEPLDRLRLIAGVRGDYYGYDVRGRDAAALAAGEGSGHDAIVSPKLSLAYAPATWLELYGNWGRGFHSNDVRGAKNVDAPVPTLVRGTGKELGVRFQKPSWSLTATYWWLSVGSELRFVGDSNSVEPSGASKRHGYELVGFVRPFSWLAIDGSYTASHARYVNGDYIPNAFENAASVGISAIFDRWEGSVRLRHLGPYPLIDDGSIRDSGSTVVNARAAWKGKRFEIYGELLNILNSRDKDIAYYYETYLPGVEPEGRVSRVLEPRSVRVGVKVRL